MKGLFFIAFVCLAWGTVAAQPGFVFPLIPDKGNTVLSFVPEGWALMDSATGDLNKDGKPDMACVLESLDSVDEMDVKKMRLPGITNPAYWWCFYTIPFLRDTTLALKIIPSFSVLMMGVSGATLMPI